MFVFLILFLPVRFVYRAGFRCPTAAPLQAGQHPCALSFCASGRHKENNHWLTKHLAPTSQIRLWDELETIYSSVSLKSFSKMYPIKTSL